MKLRRKHAVLTMLAVLLAMLCTGCGGGNEPIDTSGEAISLVIIAGRHANARMFTDQMLEKARVLIDRAVSVTEDADGYHVRAKVAVLISDGDPKKAQLEADGESLLRCEARNRGELETKRKAMVQSVVDVLRGEDLRADDEEVDLLAAISEAQKVLNGDPGAENHLLILDTGVTTTGSLDMRKIDVLQGEVEDVIGRIPDGGIPRITGTKVTFLGLGNIAEPQNDIRSNSRFTERMEQLWTGIVQEGGGELQSPIQYVASEGDAMLFYETPAEDDPGYPYVNTVIFADAESGEISVPVINIDSGTNGPKEGPAISYTLRTADLGFQANSASFRSREQAILTLNAIQPSLEKYLNETSSRLYVVGSIARTSTTPEMAQHHLAEERAEAVRNLLVNDYGVPDSRIVIIDAGTTKFSWRNAEEFPNGEQGAVDTKAQEANRIVAIIGENSESEMHELREKGYVS